MLFLACIVSFQEGRSSHHRIVCFGVTQYYIQCICVHAPPSDGTARLLLRKCAHFPLLARGNAVASCWEVHKKNKIKLNGSRDMFLDCAISSCSCTMQKHCLQDFLSLLEGNSSGGVHSFHHTTWVPDCYIVEAQLTYFLIQIQMFYCLNSLKLGQIFFTCNA